MSWRPVGRHSRVFLSGGCGWCVVRRRRGSALPWGEVVGLEGFEEVGEDAAEFDGCVAVDGVADVVHPDEGGVGEHGGGVGCCVVGEGGFHCGVCLDEEDGAFDSGECEVPVDAFADAAFDCGGVDLGVDGVEVCGVEAVACGVSMGEGFGQGGEEAVERESFSCDATDGDEEVAELGAGVSDGGVEDGGVDQDEGAYGVGGGGGEEGCNRAAE